MHAHSNDNKMAFFITIWLFNTIILLVFRLTFFVLDVTISVVLQNAFSGKSSRDRHTRRGASLSLGLAKTIRQPKYKSNCDGHSRISTKQKISASLVDDEQLENY